MDHYRKHRFEPIWHAPRRVLRSRVPAPLWDWLLDPASLTRRLQRACPGGFRVEVLEQRRELPMLSEARALGIRAGRRVLVREVRLLCRGHPWVFARTVIPNAALPGPQRRLARLRTPPRGGTLFRARSMRREALEIARIDAGQRLFRRAARPLPQPPTFIWGRRSLFRLRGKPLLVCEMFLPGIGEDCP